VPPVLAPLVPEAPSVSSSPLLPGALLPVVAVPALAVPVPASVPAVAPLADSLAPVGVVLVGAPLPVVASVPPPLLAPSGPPSDPPPHAATIATTAIHRAHMPPMYRSHRAGGSIVPSRARPRATPPRGPAVALADRRAPVRC